MATEKRKIRRVIDLEGNTVQVLPETSAEQVTLADAAGYFISDNVEGALEEVGEDIAELKTGLASAGKVDDVQDVNGASIVTNKIATLSKAAVGLGNVDNTADANKSVKHATSADSATTATSATSADSATKATKDGAGNIISDTYATKQALQDAIAGKAKSFSYDDYQKFVEAVNAFSNTQMAVNDNVLIVTLGVPDMWVKAKNATSVTYTYTTDQAIIDALNTTAGLTVGYYTFAQLETTKVDLTAYQTKTDNSLDTTDKTVVGAINQVRGAANNALLKANTNISEIAKIKDGTTTVKKAETADSAANVTENINSHAITDIFESNGITVKEATQATTAGNVSSAINGKPISDIFESDKSTVKKATRVANKLYIEGNQKDGKDNPLSLNYDGHAELSLGLYKENFTLQDTSASNAPYSSAQLRLSYTGVAADQYSAVNVDVFGRVTAGGKSIEWGTSGQTTPSGDLMVGGLFMELQ